MSQHVLERRQHFRIEYPIQARPRLQIGSLIYQVLDVSELGLRLLSEPGAAPRVAAKFQGELRMANGDQVVVSGQVVRVEGGQISIRLSRGVPLARIMSEQLFLIRSYGRPAAS